MLSLIDNGHQSDNYLSRPGAASFCIRYLHRRVVVLGEERWCSSLYQPKQPKASSFPLYLQAASCPKRSQLEQQRCVYPFPPSLFLA